MDGQMKEILVIAVVCAIVGGAVGGLAVGLMQDDHSGQAFVDVSFDIEHTDVVSFAITSTERGMVDIYHIDHPDKPLYSYEVREGITRYSERYLYPYDLDNDTVRILWRPL